MLHLYPPNIDAMAPADRAVVLTKLGLPNLTMVTTKSDEVLIHNPRSHACLVGARRVFRG